MGVFFSKPISKELSEAVFNNHLIAMEIFVGSSTVDIRHFRLVNKKFNVAACNILLHRKNQVMEFSCSHVVSRFLDTMDTRLVDLIWYSTYTFALAQINSDVIQKFGTVLANQVRILIINIVDLSAEYPEEQQDSSEAPDMNNEKAKAILLLRLFPNMAELQMEYDDDKKQNFLTSEDIMTIPSEFPNLTDFKFTHKGAVRCGPYRKIVDDPNTFMTVICSRSPKLLHIQNVGPQFYVSPSLRQLPAILSKFNPRPAVSVHAWFLLRGDVWGDNPFPLKFIYDLSSMGYNQLRIINVRLEYPSPDILIEFNQFLTRQCQALESLYVIACAQDDPNVMGPMILPAMPKLKLFVLWLYHWPLTHVHPNPLMDSQFSKLTGLTYTRQVPPYDVCIHGKCA